MEFFPELIEQSGIIHAFTLRAKGIDVDHERDTAVQNLIPFYGDCVREIGGDFELLQTAEQVHGNGIAKAGNGGEGLLPNLHLGVDALMTNEPGKLLGILVADCCAVYVFDPVHRAIGLAHSGKKGSELGIVLTMLRRMNDAYGTSPAEVIVRLSPCIRPPDYEVDFASDIRRQCSTVGVPEDSIHDDLISTAKNPERYYSYRVEKGRTGRMLALLGIQVGQM